NDYSQSFIAFGIQFHLFYNYSTDRQSNQRLKYIHPSCKALNTLMQWFGDLEPPYTMYCKQYYSSFDAREPVHNVPHLLDVLTVFSATLPPPTPYLPVSLSGCV
ncbi:hypothetical protein V8E53_001378, partial [Lactarius tabidus]